MRRRSKINCDEYGVNGRCDRGNCRCRHDSQGMKRPLSLLEDYGGGYLIVSPRELFEIEMRERNLIDEAEEFGPLLNG